MHVNTRKLAVSGLLMAFDVVLIILSGIIDFNTLFLLAAAAFLVGVIIREFDLKYDWLSLWEALSWEYSWRLRNFTVLLMQ